MYIVNSILMAIRSDLFVYIFWLAVALMRYIYRIYDYFLNEMDELRGNLRVSWYPEKLRKKRTTNIEKTGDEKWQAFTHRIPISFASAKESLKIFKTKLLCNYLFKIQNPTWYISSFWVLVLKWECIRCAHTNSHIHGKRTPYTFKCVCRRS